MIPFLPIVMEVSKKSINQEPPDNQEQNLLTWLSGPPYAETLHQNGPS